MIQFISLSNQLKSDLNRNTIVILQLKPLNESWKSKLFRPLCASTSVLVLTSVLHKVQHPFIELLLLNQIPVVIVDASANGLHSEIVMDGFMETATGGLILYNKILFPHYIRDYR